MSWYIYISNSSPFITIVKFGNHIISTFFTEFLNPESSSALYILTTELPLSLQILRVLILISIFFISVGILDLLYKLAKNKITNFSLEYSFLSIISYGFLLFTFSKIMGAERVLHILSIFLSPFCIIGSIIFLNLTRYLIRLKFSDLDNLRIISIFLCFFFLLSSNFISITVTKDYPAPYLISHNKIEEYVKDDRLEMWKAHVYSCYIMEQDVFGARWLSTNKGKAEIWADWKSCWMPLSAYGMMGPQRETGWEYGVTHVLTNKTKINQEAYIYLRYFNTKEGIMLSGVHSRDWYNVTDISYILTNSNKIYTNGGSEIYHC